MEIFDSFYLVGKLEYFVVLGHPCSYQTSGVSPLQRKPLLLIEVTWCEVVTGEIGAEMI